MLVGDLLPCETYRGGARVYIAGGIWGGEYGAFGHKIRHHSLRRQSLYKHFTLKGWRAVWGYRTTSVDNCQSLFHIESARFLVKK